ncbi:MAG: FixH family protein [Haliscomenobacter sp.]
MKFNWGTGIALFYGTFVVVLLYFVFKSTGQDNSLVSEEYYAEDLSYQKHYDKLRNAQALEKDLDISAPANSGKVVLQFPDNLGAVTGQIQFFCPSDSKQDFTVPVQTDTSYAQSVPNTSLKKGMWRVKVNWSAGETEYYREEILHFQ